jgi:ATP-binding cassette subfamily B protein
MAALILPYGWWLPPLLLAGTFPALYVVIRHTLRRHAWRLKTTADDRRTWYYDWLLTSREAAAELRLFNLGRFFQEAYQTVRRRLRRGRLQLIRNEALAGLWAGAAGLVTAGGAMAWMAWRALQGHATLGDLALFFQAFSRGQGLMRSLLEDVARIYGNSLFLGDLFQFLELRPEVTDPAEAKSLAPPIQGSAIRFHDVFFQYPGSDRPTLNGLNLEIPAGRIAAIVGANGAGKSTLVKLLCRFYDPVSGKVELDGTDLRTLPLSLVRSRVAALFQEPVQYSATVAQNISLTQHLDPEMQAAVTAAGADEIIDRLPSGYDTLLGTWFEGGTDLSVGEWQRLALARAFFRSSPVLVMDEPTSAMDPWAEAAWLRGLHAAARGRTVLIITHRLTTAMAADVIHVMAGGQVIESGTHAALIGAGGAYAKSWAMGGRR